MPIPGVLLARHRGECTMTTITRLRSALIASAALAALTGCAGSAPRAGEPVVEAPAYRVGDRWVYHVEDGYRLKIVWEETHEVTAIGADGVTVRITQKGPSTDLSRTERWSSPGRVNVGALCNEDTRQFATAL